MRNQLKQKNKQNMMLLLRPPKLLLVVKMLASFLGTSIFPVPMILAVVGKKEF